MVCDLDCLADYSCDQNPIAPENGAVFSPYVLLHFGEDEISVGNQSSENFSNHAAITSFQISGTPGDGGCKAVFEIVDQGGVAYRQIIRGLNKTAGNKVVELSQIYVDFGWTIKNCDGNIRKLTLQSLTGRVIRLLLVEVEQTFESGLVKLKVTLDNPLIHIIPDTRHNDAIGGEGPNEGVTLKKAIKILFTERHPKFSDVKFLARDGSELQFTGGPANASGDGPLKRWPCNQMNSLSICRNWLNEVRSKDGHGLIITYNSCTEDGEPADYIVIMEDPMIAGCCPTPRNLGTYIVNGGNCSPVIEFMPAIKWPLGMMPGGGKVAGGAVSGKSDTNEDTDKNRQHAGPQAAISVPESAMRSTPPSNQAEEAAKNNAAHVIANAPFALNYPVGLQADLKIMGDPRYGNFLSLIGAFVSIVVINPFRIDDECKWGIALSESNCNSILSNKNWFVIGADHQIQGGSFTTTLRVSLIEPNRQADANQPLGGCGPEVFTDVLGATRAINANSNE